MTDREITKEVVLSLIIAGVIALFLKLVASPILGEWFWPMYVAVLIVGGTIIFVKYLRQKSH